MTLERILETAISEATGTPFGPARSSDAGGGCIHQARLFEDEHRRFFVKTNRSDAAALFATEAQALTELVAAATALRIPRPITHGQHGAHAFLVLEYLPLGGRGGPAGYRQLGEQLAALHAVTASEHGWHTDNFIGSTPQPNTWQPSWSAFFRTQRLEHQLDLAQARGAGRRLIERGAKLAAHLDALLGDHHPTPSLLHGDLWGGNADFTRSGEPTIYDPATYYGDRETDLAMSELFGGFPTAFYEGYDAIWPRSDGYAVRRELYQLYHVLNHYNLFGGMYQQQAQRQIDRLLAEIGH
ncbi:hypothetical protein CKO15_03835 [Halorhodospira abdelmalekii]|uniref:fructosamine kinase family protein n=1 Tax=Halorhodospira abdelmalekii TaxID=421629 RepID=UPI001906E168|nr:fructosamine kinase family protein [Halorhodospira abdelmalekii]MBK1734431.1 hypothetical protein [Halorhodospira abdelmalekii]